MTGHSHCSLAHNCFSHCIDGSCLHHFIGSMIMSSWPATPSTIEEKLPSCFPSSIVSKLSRSRWHFLFLKPRHCQDSTFPWFSLFAAAQDISYQQPSSFPSGSSVSTIQSCQFLVASTTISLWRCNSHSRPAVVPYDLPLSQSKLQVIFSLLSFFTTNVFHHQSFYRSDSQSMESRLARR